MRHLATKGLTLALCATATLSACKKNKSSDPAAISVATTTTAAPSKKKSVDDGVSTAAIGELALAGTLSIIPAQGGDLSLHLNGTDYDLDKTNLYVKDDSFEALDSAGFIYCFISKLGYIEMVNKGTYIAQVAEEDCGEKGGSGQQSDSQRGVKEYSNVKVISTREEGKPLVVKFWLNEEKKSDDGSSKAIFGRITIVEGATATNPIGVFRMLWNQGGDGGGGLEARMDDDGNILVLLVDESSRESESYYQGVRAVLNRNADGEVVGGVMHSRNMYARGDQPEGSSDSIYKVAFNDTAVLRSKDGAAEKCLNRNDFDVLAWNYNLYDADGARADLKSSFNIEFTDGEGILRRGQIGYYGAWVENDIALADGDEVERVLDWNAHTTKTYVVHKSKGKLMKNTRVALSATDIVGVELGGWNETGMVRVVWDGTSFNSNGTWQNSNNGNGSWQDATPAAYTLQTGSNNFWSESLGQVEIGWTGTAIESVTVTKTEDVTSSAGDLSLACYSDCLKTSIVQADVAGTDGVYPHDYAQMDWDNRPTWGTDPVIAYTYDAATLSLKRASTPVAIASGVTLENSQQYQNGIRSGAMILASDATSEDAFLTAAVFYTWETGTKDWNVFTGVKDKETGSWATFDAPVQFMYTHSLANDADGRGTDFFGKKFRMQFGGPGQLWGIPSEQSAHGYYQPLFSIKTGTKVGNNAEYTVKIMDGEQRMREADAGLCAALSLAGAPTLPVRTELPTIDFEDAPAGTGLVVSVKDGMILE